MARTIAKDHEVKRRQILKVAAKVFAQEGYDRASVSQVALACSISKANIYHYYGSKEDLLFDILDSYLSGLRDRICNFEAPNLSPSAYFEALLVEFLMAYQGADDEHRLQTIELPRLSSARQAPLKGYQRELVASVSSALSAVGAENLCDSPSKLKAVTMSVFGMLNWFYMWNGSAGEEERRAYGGTVARLTLRGVEQV